MINFKNKTGENFIAKLALAVCAFFSCMYIFFIMHNAEWIFVDNWEFMITVCKKIPKSPLMQIFQGRFFVQYDYNILLLTPFYDNIHAYYVINILEYIIFSIFMYFTAKEICYRVKSDYPISENMFYTIFAFVYMVLHCVIVKVFLDIVYPEKFLITLLSCITYFLLLSERTEKIRFAVIAVILGVMATYLKEPVFGLLLVIGFCLFLGNFKTLKKWQITLLTGYVINAIVYVSLYLYFCGKYKNHEFFAYGHLYGSRLSALIFLLLRYKALIIISIIGLTEIIKFFRNCKIEWKFSVINTFSVASLAYFGAFYILRLWFDYYFYPCYFLIAPSIILLSCKFIYDFQISYKGKVISQILILFTFFIIALFPALHIFRRETSNINHQRTTEFAALKQVAQRVRSGGNVYLLDTKNDNSNDLSFKLPLSLVLTKHINFINKTDDFNFTIVNKLPQILKDTDVILAEDQISELDSNSDYEKIYFWFHPTYIKKN